jgi:PAS domain S-box-containing protein
MSTPDSALQPLPLLLLLSGVLVLAGLALAAIIAVRRSSKAAVSLAMSQLNEAQRVANVGSFTFDVASDHLTTSPQLDDMLGFGSGHVKNTGAWREWLHPDDRQAMETALADCLERGVPCDRDYRIIRRSDGQTRWLRCIAKAERDPSGKIMRVNGVNIDITERAQTESALRDAVAEARRFRETLDHVSDHIYFKDLQSRYLYANRKTLKLFGCSAEEVVGCDDSHFFALETARQLWQIDARVFQGEQASQELDLAGANGERRIYWDVKIPIYADPEHTTISGLVGISTDITERRRAESEKDDAVRFLQSLLAASPISIFTYEATGQTVLANQAAARLVGTTVEEVVQFNFRELDSWKNSGLLGAADLALATGQPQVWEGQLVSSYGQARWVSGRLVPFLFAGKTHLLLLAQDITEGRRVEEENRTILRTMIDAFYLVDLEGRILEANDAYCSMIGYSVEELRKIGVAGVEAIETQEVINQRIERILETGFDRFETRHIRKDGRVIEVEASVNLLREPGRLFIFMRDITARKQTDHVLRVLQDRFANAMDQAHLVHWDMDASTNTFSFNDQFYALYGTTAEREGGYLMPVEVYFREFVPVEERHVLSDDVARLLSGEIDVLQQEHCMLRRDGEVRSILVRVTVVRDPDGRVVGTRGTNQDITDLRQAETALHLFKDLVENSSDAIAMSDPDGKHYYQNEAFDRLFGDAGDRSPRSLFVDRGIGKEVFDTIMGGGCWQGEVKMFKYDETTMTIFLRAYAIKDGAGRILGLVGLHTDITERQWEEEKLRRSERQLRESQQVAQLGSWDCDVITPKLEWSDQTYELFDRPAATYVPSFDEFARLVHPEDRDMMQTSFGRALASDDDPYHVKVRIINDSGRQWVMEAFGAVRRDSGGRPLSIYGTAQDITDRVAQEQKLRELLAQTE